MSAGFKCSITCEQNTPSNSFSTSNDVPSFQSNPAPAPQQTNTWTPAPVVNTPPQPQVSSSEIFGLLEKLADLHAKGILTDAEYETKKAEMLKRL